MASQENQNLHLSHNHSWKLSDQALLRSIHVNYLHSSLNLNIFCYTWSDGVELFISRFKLPFELVEEGGISLGKVGPVLSLSWAPIVFKVNGKFLYL